MSQPSSTNGSTPARLLQPSLMESVDSLEAILDNPTATTQERATAAIQILRATMGSLDLSSLMSELENYLARRPTC